MTMSSWETSYTARKPLRLRRYVAGKGMNTTTTQQNSFIEALEGDLTPQQAAELLELGEGDTSTTLETEIVPGDQADGDAVTDKNEAGKGNEAVDGAAATKVDESTLNNDNAVILAKDGKHTIEYDRLVEARLGKQNADAKLLDTEAKLATANAALAELQAAAQARADAGEVATKADNQAAIAQEAINDGEDPAMFGDFSEEALAKGIQKLVSMQVTAAVAKIDAKLNPIQQQQQANAADAHYNTIYEKHPDADSIAESKELNDWINSQPSFVRDGYSNVLSKGTTQQVIELFDSFKSATGTQAAVDDTATKKVDVKEAAKQAIASAKPAAPNTLSDIPGGRPGAGATREDTLADMGAPDMLDAMVGMSPEQIEKFLNRQI